MTTSTKRRSVLVPLGAALAVLIGVAAAAGTAGASPAQVHAAAYRLTATLSAAQEVPAVQAPAAANGRFNAVLFRSGVGVAKIAALAGCKVIVPPRRSGLPTRITCNGSVVTLPAPGQWRLLWRLSVSGLSGPATAAGIHIAPAGHAAPPAFALCGPCGSVSHGYLAITAGQANSLVGNASYVNVTTAANPGGEIRGQIVRTTIGFSAGRL